MSDAAARFAQQVGFIGERDPGTEAFVRGYEVADHFRKMVHVDDDLVVAGCHQLLHHVLQERLAAHGHEGFGHRVGEGFEPGSETGGENERFHLAARVPFRFPVPGA